MKHLYTLLLTFCLSTCLSFLVLAQETKKQRGTRTPVITARQGRQQRRVARGVKSGELTKKETKSLAGDMKEIKEAKTEAKADGTVTREERKEIQQQQNQTSRKIYRKKHNNRSRKQ